MAEEQNPRSLAFQISNNTENITLKFHSFDREFHGSPRPNPELPPGLSDCCQIFGDPDSPGVEQLLVYEAESFTLAVFVRVSGRPGGSAGALRLELSPDKVHLRHGDETRARMRSAGDPPDPDGTASARCAFPGETWGCVQLNGGPCNATATVCHRPRPLLAMALDQRQRSVHDFQRETFPDCEIL